MWDGPNCGNGSRSSMPWPILGEGLDGEHAIGVCATISLTCVGRRWCITCMSSPACLRSLRRKRPDYLTDALVARGSAATGLGLRCDDVEETLYRAGGKPGVSGLCHSGGVESGGRSRKGSLG